MKNALIIIDMLNDFVDGVLANKDAYEIIPRIKSLLEHARKSEDWVVVYSNDAHKDGDREIKLWGAHAVVGTAGAEVVSDLSPQKSGRELISPKSFYGAFEETGLAEKLKAKGIKNVYLTGQHTNCCVRHTAYGAFRHDFEIFVPKDAVVSFGGESNDDALNYLKTIYGAIITDVQEILAGKS
ncbi:MAG: cysteine hydrolase [Cytophagales bacterium]|nr:cysteine hydrolase [Cytophagales bacterium]